MNKTQFIELNNSFSPYDFACFIFYKLVWKNLIGVEMNKNNHIQHKTNLFQEHMKCDFCCQAHLYPWQCRVQYVIKSNAVFFTIRKIKSERF